jgi:N-acetylglucosamine kinase-like BadF-type ATPase
MGWKIGVDGGGTKTECILLDPDGAVAARHVAPGCNPSIAGQERARELITAALHAVRAGRVGGASGADAPAVEVESTLLCVAGSRPFWQEFAAGLRHFGRVQAVDDSLPVLELATLGAPGLALHAGTGSFVAARTPSGAVHYAGGLGWRIGDEGSGYDLGRRALARACLELQGTAPPSALGDRIRARVGLATLPAVLDQVYGDPAPNAQIAGLAPEVLSAAGDGDPGAAEIIRASTAGLLDVAHLTAKTCFPGADPRTLRAGISGAILNHPFVFALLAREAPFALAPVIEAPIEGVRLLLLRCLPGSAG